MYTMDARGELRANRVPTYTALWQISDAVLASVGERLECSS